MEPRIPPTRPPKPASKPERPITPTPPTTWRQKFERTNRTRAELQKYFDSPKYQAKLIGNSADVREPGSPGHPGRRHGPP